MNSVVKLNYLYSQLSALPDLKPGERTNDLFSQLVTLARSEKEDLIKNFTHRRELLGLCSQSEYELELYWSNRIAKSKNPQAEITRFPYWNNYMKLALKEMALLEQCTDHKEHKILFIGGGPLPMTAIVLVLTTGLKITILDQDLTACYRSEKLIEKLQLSKKINIVHCDAKSFKKYRAFNVVYQAALVGSDWMEQVEIINYIRNQITQGTHILVRGAHGNRRLLYREFDADKVSGLKNVLDFHPTDEVVNSVHILQK